MLLQITIRNIARRQHQHFLLSQQWTRLKVTPISSHLHFLRNDSEPKPKLKTGFASDFHKSIHSQSQICFKYVRPQEVKDKPVVDNQQIQSSLDDASKIGLFARTKKISNEQKVEDKPAVDIEQIQTGLDDASKLGLFARFKKMAKEYWYVLIPVHVATSACWLLGFYYASSSGVDIMSILETCRVPEKVTIHLRDSSLGHWAVAYLLYKIATPARYFVTLTGTTFAIRQGIQYGVIKPMPTKDQLVQIYKDKKEDLQQKVADKKQAYHDKKIEFQDKFKTKN